MKRTIIAALLTLLLLAACNAPATEEPTTAPPEGESPAYINEMQLLVAESFPVQVFLSIQGDLPTPCHMLENDIQPPDDDNRIVVTLASSAPTDQDCITVLEPFETNLSIPMLDQPDGEYTVIVNGEEAGTFSYPG